MNGGSGGDSNPRPADYESDALPTELRNHYSFFNFKASARFEPYFGDATISFLHGLIRTFTDFATPTLKVKV